MFNYNNWTPSVLFSKNDKWKFKLQIKHIYISQFLWGNSGKTEVESKSRMTEHRGKRSSGTPSYVRGNFITGSNTSRDFSSSEEVQTRRQKERKREKGESALAVITWRKSRSINDVVLARQRWRLSRSKGAVGHRVLTPTNQFTSLEKSFAKTRGEMTVSGRRRRETAGIVLPPTIFPSGGNSLLKRSCCVMIS